MKKIFLLIIPFCFAFAFTSSGQKNYAKLVDSLQYVTKVPYIHNCDDPIFWKIVGEGKNIVPFLIDKMTDTTTLKEIYVPNFGGEYTVADVAYIAIQEIIAGIPTLKLLGVSFDKVCGYCSYWNHVRYSVENRVKFQSAVRHWYEQNKNKLVWVDYFGILAGECPSPIKGHYEVKRKEKGK